MFKLVKKLLIGGLLALPLHVSAKIQVFACEPEWAALAQEIGQDQVEVFSATHANQDPHYIRARPSLIAKARKADLLICSGADLESGWLPILLQKASRNVQPGALGHLMAAQFVTLLEKPNSIDRSHGDVHPEGNPHIHLNPHNLLLVAKEVNLRLQKIEPRHAEQFKKNFENFQSTWQESIKRWESQITSLNGMKVIVHHKTFSYLIHWIGLVQVNSIEPKPGIEPTPSHLQGLLKTIKNQNVIAILRTPYEPKKPSQWLSNQSEISAIELPYTVGGNDQASDLIGLFDDTIHRLTDSKKNAGQ